MDVKGLFAPLFLGLALWPMTASMGHAQSVAVREESAVRTRQTLITLTEKQAPLAKVLRDIATQANLAVAILGKVSEYPSRVTINVREMPLDQVLAKVLEGTGFRATVAAGAIMFSESVSATAASVTQGSISGKVIDRKTRQGLRGATVSLSGTTKGTTTSDDGSFRFSGVAPGSYTIQVRMLGYVKISKPVTITEGATASVEVVLEQSVNALDQVVVTGTIVATAQREIPNAMTVITAKDLEQRGITKIDQLFRGDVPGLFALNQGSNGALDEVLMFSRGATALTDEGGSTGKRFTNPMKTYVDGVELVDPKYLNQIDPKSIERIEIVTGPQASTIYGSNGINGVMQIFTKRGSTSRPQLTATLLSGWVENSFRPTRTPQHDDAVQVTGMEGRWAYNAGGSWNYMGPWTPGKQTSRLSGFGGTRVQRGSMTVDGSLRLATTKTRQEGATTQTFTAFLESGWYTPSSAVGFLAPRVQTLVGQTLGLTLGFTPVSWWSQQLVLGNDRSDTESRQLAVGNTSRSDTLLTLTQRSSVRRSLGYRSTVQMPLASVARAVVTVGADAWQNLTTSLSVSALALTGTLVPSGSPTVTRQPGHNAGGFLQAQVGLWDQLFVTYGVRAEWNPTYGEEAQPNLAPRYGMSLTRDFDTPLGMVTAKLRGSYGRSTRPPAVGQRDRQTVTAAFGASAITQYVPYFGDFDYVRANPELGPEHQQGGEGGLELYLGNRGSLVVTRYNQTIDGLIARPKTDSARTLVPNVTPYSYNSKDDEGYYYFSTYQYLNVASIRNQGWELQGTVNIGPFTTQGTYSWTKSRTLGVTPQYRALFTPPSEWPQYQAGASFKFLPEHTWGANVTYARGSSMVTLHLSGTGMLTNTVNEQYATAISGSVRLTANRVRLNQGSYAYLNAGYVQADLNASQRFSSRVDGVLQVLNLGDMYHNDEWFAYTTLGRQTKFGLRMRL